jgi:hypothetical protein
VSFEFGMYWTKRRTIDVFIFAWEKVTGWQRGGSHL